MNAGAALREALGYFTILPVPTPAAPPSPDAVALLPLVGMTIGAISGCVARGLGTVAPAPLVCATAYALPIVLSGALHADGFLDVCDALFAQVTPERRREILRDPHHGSFALAAQGIATTLGYSSVASMPPERLPFALAFSEGTGRLAALFVAAGAPNASGTAASAFEKPPDGRLVAAQAALLVALGLITGGFPLVIGAACVAGAARTSVPYLARAFGGALGGDAYGFTIVTVELATLALAAAMARDDRD